MREHAREHVRVHVRGDGGVHLHERGAQRVRVSALLHETRGASSSGIHQSALSDGTASKNCGALGHTSPPSSTNVAPALVDAHGAAERGRESGASTATP